MKKIFAIALALVMVLSMASAFASPCTSGFSWVEKADATKCGKATVEVVPYVKTNAACDKVSYVQSDCAAAVNGEHVNFALKLTVPADIDAEWWHQVRIFLTVKGMKEYTANEAEILDGVSIAASTDASEDGWVYYYVIGKGWVEATENKDFDIASVMNTYTVAEYAKAKVCFTLKSEEKSFTEGTLGDYYVKVLPLGEKEGVMLIVDADDAAKVEDPVVGLAANLAAAKAAYEVLNPGKTFVPTLSDLANAMPVENAVGYIYANGEVAVVGKVNNNCSTSFYNAVTSFFGINLGTKMTTKLINDNFGWKDKAESCFAWKTQNAMAVVDSECVVAIPKTGDASVLAWLF